LTFLFLQRPHPVRVLRCDLREQKLAALESISSICRSAMTARSGARRCRVKEGHGLLPDWEVYDSWSDIWATVRVSWPSLYICSVVEDTCLSSQNVAGRFQVNVTKVSRIRTECENRLPKAELCFCPRYVYNAPCANECIRREYPKRRKQWTIFLATYASGDQPRRNWRVTSLYKRVRDASKCARSARCLSWTAG
jgi:hypothetical protein